MIHVYVVWWRKSEQKNKSRSSLCCGLVIVNGLRASLWFGAPELTVPVQVEIDLERIVWEVGIVGDPVIPLGGWGGPASSIRPRSESILFSRMVLDLRTLSANLTSPNHNDIHSHVVSHGLSWSDVGRRWLLTTVVSHHLSNNIACFSSLSTVLSIIVSSSYHRSEIFFIYSSVMAEKVQFCLGKADVSTWGKLGSNSITALWYLRK